MHPTPFYSKIFTYIPPCADHYAMLAQNNHNNRMARVVANGFIMLGRCIPSVCTDQDLAAGWYNFLTQAEIDGFILYPLNCHTADEKSKILFC